MAVVLNGHTYQASDFIGSNGFGYNTVNSTTGLLQFPDSIFTDMIAHLNGAASSNGVAAGAAGGYLRSNGTVWTRVTDLTPGSSGGASLGASALPWLNTYSNVVVIGTDPTGAQLLRVGGAARIGGLLTADAGITLSAGALTAINAVLSGTLQINGIAYTWPAAQSAGQVLTTNGGGTLSWATPSSGVTNGKAIAFAMLFS